MAERDNPLMYGCPAPKWRKLAAKESVRCDPTRGGCGTIHPGRFMAEIDPATGLCQRCSNAPNAVIAEQRGVEWSVRIVDRVAWAFLPILAGLALAAWMLSGCAAPMAGYGYSSQPSQIVEFYDSGGRSVGYGKVQGGNIELFSPDSSRRGFGKTGR